MASTYVDLTTNFGDIDIQLYDDDAPKTVANFLSYAAGPYVNSFFHRLVSGFVLQGGGYTYTTGVQTITAMPPVVNEFSSSRSNLAHTVAMAKLGGDPNSATDQFFFNLGDNSSNLDNQNGGFTVFGKVTDDTWATVQKIAALPVYNAGSPFDSLPLTNYTSGTVGASNLAIISAVTTAPVPFSSIQYTDTVTNSAGSTAGTAYTGPVQGLSREYIWGSTHNVALAATIPNVFIHGGVGDDAISVSGGTNVIDGGAGSNFLIGGTGADGGTDTFFVDGRGGAVTWSTVVNFHSGDAVTLFGFGASSTRPWTPTDGATGYQGATIHSELGGTGTGVNASVTFTGISLDQALSRFTISQGTVGGSDYLYVAYTG